ncbi:MAG: MarR family transcriptional regulator [Holophagales bacterium]|nr:MarR family transcriptional regulator [Holophagales bacterium]
MLVSLRRIARTIDLRSRDLMRRFGLTVPQLVALREIERRGEITGSALAREVSLSQATVTGILKRLEARQLVERRRSDKDRRAIVIRLTPLGCQLVADAPSPLQSRFTQRLEGLADWERNMILAALQRLVGLMEVEDLDAGPYLATGAADAPPLRSHTVLEEPVASDQPGFVTAVAEEKDVLEQVLRQEEPIPED